MNTDTARERALCFVVKLQGKLMAISVGTRHDPGLVRKRLALIAFQLVVAVVAVKNVDWQRSSLNGYMIVKL